ncbi:PREDICTED: cytohesin-4-like, partial [Priapulus caudatus]|uniref:Cytohesin-4-like n=1 Tax=Priapulus caudatus TaxID=37621 RepID=A0ABM1EZM1_PRICU
LLKDELADVTREMEAADVSEAYCVFHALTLCCIMRSMLTLPCRTLQGIEYLIEHGLLQNFKFHGIEYLIEHGLLQNCKEDVAQFLFKGEGLNKTAIGEYLGER